MFHYIVAKIMWEIKRAQPDTETYIYFLYTRVLKPTEDDKKKLKILLQLLNCTIDDDCIIGADNLHNLEVWVDTSYVVQDDMRVHTDRCIYMGLGMVHLHA